MADSAFWRSLATKFEKIDDPNEGLRLEWARSNRTGENWQILSAPGYPDSTSYFLELASIAGAALILPDWIGDSVRWFSLLRDKYPIHAPRNTTITDPDGSEEILTGGAVLQAKRKSIEQCSILEAQETRKEWLLERVPRVPANALIGAMMSGTTDDAKRLVITEAKRIAGSGEDCKRQRRDQIGTFLARCNEVSSKRIYKRHIWRSAGHSNARQFEYWQECSRKATNEDERNFGRILKTKPADFVALLERQKLIS